MCVVVCSCSCSCCGCWLLVVGVLLVRCCCCRLHENNIYLWQQNKYEMDCVLYKQNTVNRITT
jgi:hypothetical protein